MKETAAKFTVKRLSSSPYFSPTFKKLEEETITCLTKATMLAPNSDQCAHVLITNTHTDVSSIPKKELEMCQLMIHPNSGYDNFGSAFISMAHFPIVIGNPIRAHAVANFILSALFSHYSAILAEPAWNDLRKWPRKLLSELNILIIGHGHIGALLNKCLTHLAKEVRIYDPYAGFPELNLQNIDVLIPVCSLNKENHHLIDETMLMALNEDFLLINAARGSLVNTEDLLSILAKRPRAFAVLDVFEKEPADFKQLAKATKNIKLSSHIAGVYQNIDITTANFEARVIFEFMTLEKPVFENIYKTMILKNRLIAQNFLI